MTDVSRAIYSGDWELIERQDDKSPNDTQTQTIVYGKEYEKNG